jgi:hypothetical protein
MNSKRNSEPLLKDFVKEPEIPSDSAPSGSGEWPKIIDKDPLLF